MKARYVWLTASLLLACGASRGAEVASNSSGGGPWSDPATWRGNVVPAPADDVVIQKHDIVVFDRNDDGKVSCHKLLLDPKGILLLKTGAGKVICAVSNGVESFGVIKLDGTKAASDTQELRLVGDKADMRQVKIGRGGGLLMYGRPDLPGGARNVGLVAPPSTDPKDDLTGLVEADGAATIDWQRAAVGDVKLVAKNLDNTGAKANERINVIECRFTGKARLHCVGCDSPVVRKNTVDYAGPAVIQEAALNVYQSPLAEIRGNVVRGPFLVGIAINAESDPVVIDNVVEKCTIGIQGGYGIPNTMIKKAMVRGCETGIRLEGATGVVEDITIEGATTAYHQMSGRLQFADLRVNGLAPKGAAVLWETGMMRLLNTNITPEQVKMTPPATLPVDQAPVPVKVLRCLVVTVKDAPPGALVEVRPKNAPPPAAAADPDVRHSPSPLTAGRTPPPGSPAPLVVGAWGMDVKGNLLPGTEYVVTVLGPPVKEGDARPVLKTLSYRPDEKTLRAPSDVPLTLEVSLK